MEISQPLKGSDKLRGYIQLTRINRPIGIYLLLWPTYWALWIAADGVPALDILLIFTLGVVLMRSAGCVINDYADRNFDGHVKRTQDRPLPAGRVTPREALYLFVVLSLIAFVLVLFTNTATVLLSLGGVALAAAYPFMKRYTHLPQVVLGAAFSWAIPMGFCAVTGSVPAEAWLLYAANLLWTVAYDTQYAMADRDDDLKIGIKSTAILFGEADTLMIALLQGLTLVSLALLGQQQAFGMPYFAGLLIAVCLFAYQFSLTRDRQRDRCFQAFLNNHWVGSVVFAGILLDYLF